MSWCWKNHLLYFNSYILFQNLIVYFLPYVICFVRHSTIAYQCLICFLFGNIQVPRSCNDYIFPFSTITFFPYFTSAKMSSWNMPTLDRNYSLTFITLTGKRYYNHDRKLLKPSNKHVMKTRVDANAVFLICHDFNYIW